MIKVSKYVVMIAGVCALALWLIWGAIHCTERRRRIAPVDLYPTTADLLMVPPLFGIFLVAHVASRYGLSPVARKCILKKDSWSEIVYNARVDRCASAVFKSLFFMCVSAYCYLYVLRNAEWTPPALGGHGELKGCWGAGRSSDTQEKPSRHVHNLFIVSLAYHLSELVFQVVFDSDKPDLMTMTVHHVTTIVLIFCSFWMNFTRIASLVVFVHDVSDVPVYLAKIFVDTPYKYVTFSFYLGMLASWGYMRLYVLPRHLISSVYFDSVVDRLEHGSIVWLSFVVGLVLLQCLHILWYWKFLKMGYGFLVSGKTEDQQANLTAMRKRK